MEEIEKETDLAISEIPSKMKNLPLSVNTADKIKFLRNCIQKMVEETKGIENHTTVSILNTKFVSQESLQVLKKQYEAM